MKRLFSLLLSHPLIVLACAAVTTACGWAALRGCPVDVFPDIKVPRVVIQTETGGLTAEETERLVTLPIESVMNGIPGVKKIRSSSSGGLSFVWVDFDWDQDVTRARYSVFERLSQAKDLIPDGIEPEIAPIVSVTGEVMMLAVGVDESKMSLLDARQLCEYDLAKRILSIPGIGDVVTLGGRLPEFRIAVDPRRLTAFDLTVNDILEAAKSSTTLASAGYLADVRGYEIPLRQTARAESVDALRQAAVPNPSGAPVKLGDVARVEIGGAPRRGSASYNGKPVILLSIQKTPGGNTLELTRKINALLDTFSAAHAKDGLEIHREAYAQTEFIDFSIHEEKGLVLSAALIVVAVLGLTLLRVRTVLITLLTMPLSVLIGFTLFPRLGLGVDLMTLGGLAVAVGDIVDAAIIFVEIIWRRLGENAARPDPQPKNEVIAAAAAEVLPSVLFSTLIILLVFAPLLFLDGLESQFFKPLGLAYLSVFGASFFVAVTVTPVLCGLLWRSRTPGTRAVPRNAGETSPSCPQGTAEPGTRGRAHRQAADSVAVRMLKFLYRPLLRGALRFPVTLTLLLVALLGVAVWTAGGFGSGFLPPFHENCYTVLVSMPPGTSLDETERVSDGAAALIRAIAGVQSVIRRTGRAERDQHAEPVSASELVVRVDMKADAARIRREIIDAARGIPGVSVEVGYPIAHRISAVLSGTAAELTLNIFGEDLATLRKVAADVRKEMEKMPEAGDVRANREITVGTIRIDYDLPALAEAGLTLKDAGEQVSVAFNGGVCARVMRQRFAWDVTVRLDTEGPADIGTVRDLLLASPSGKRVRLGDVAAVHAEEAANLVVREHGRRMALISCNAAPGSNVGALVNALRARVEPIVHAAGCDISYGGSYEASQSATQRLTLLGIGLLCAVFMLLTVSLKSGLNAFLVLVNVPLCLIGGIFTLACTQPVFTVASIVGFITAVGFVIRNGLLLLHRYRELEEQGMERNAAVFEGSQERMAPILMTSLTTILGLGPLAFAWNRPGGELLGPLALVQFGGLISATLLNLIALPAIYKLAHAFHVRGTGPAAAALLLGALAAGCRSYEAKPVDWAAEETAWNGQAPVDLLLSTREELTQIALIGNPEINALRRKHLASEKLAAANGWWEDPTLSFSAQRILQSAEHPFLGGAELGFTLPLAGVPKLEETAARQYAAADAAAVRAAEQSLSVDAFQALIRLQAEKRRHEILSACATNDAYLAVLARLDDLVRVGEVSAAETQFARQDLVREKIAVEEKRMDVIRAEAELRKLLGLAPHIRLRIAGELETAADHLHQDAEAVRPDLTRHPLVRERLARLEGGETNLLAEIRRQYGTLSVGPSYDREDGQDRLGFGVGLTLPIWNRNRKGIAEAESTRDEQRLDAVQTWRALMTDWQAAVEQTTRTHIHHEEESVSPRQMRTLFDCGELTALEFVTFHKEHYQIRLDRTDCEEKAALACSQLERFNVGN